jgi:uncharacterized protein YyaL (SSP411 family)
MSAGLFGQEPDVDNEHRDPLRAPLHQNALANETSPYLLQHAHNPVHWYPWGAEAFERAKRENKPIFLSIGYSTCYWCHVMERESFERQEVADVLNKHYIAIKVDREERPDIDEQMMLATQLMTGSGGWPNSLWLTSDGRPWMAATYIPRVQFIDALEKLAVVWKSEAEAVQKQADSLTTAVRKASQVRTAAIVQAGESPLEVALSELGQLYDEQHAGFGAKPKFPPHGALRLLALAARHGDERALHMLTQTLDAMWSGGIHDHIGGGFHRYSTDEKWLLPHFEKMLYDNAQLMRAYAEAYDITGEEAYRRAVEDIFEWLQREMLHPAGSFFSALDSESEGEEGRFYTWTTEEVVSVLGAEAADRFQQIYLFQPQGNIVEEATGERPGTNIPHLHWNPSQRPEPVAPAQGWLSKLRDERDNRIYPHLDDKVLTGWNGLTISALAYSGRVLNDDKYVEVAGRAAEFILNELQPADVLLHTWREGRASIPAYLDDYAYLIEALLELYYATGEQKWLDSADSLGLKMLEQFEDKEQGGFFFTGPQHEDLLVRSKNLLGGGNIPDANGVAMQVLIALHDEVGHAPYLSAARKALDALAMLALQSPRQVEHVVLADAIFRQRKATLAGAPDLPPLATDAANPNKQPPETQVPQPAAVHRDLPVVTSLYLSHTHRVAGAELSVAITFAIRDGYHLYASGDGLADAELSTVVPTQVRLLDSDWTVIDQSSPAGRPLLDPVLGQTISIYEGTVWYLMKVKIPPQISLGERELRIEVQYQACDSRRCLQPQTFELSTLIDVVESADLERPAAEANIFERR